MINEERFIGLICIISSAVHKLCFGGVYQVPVYIRASSEFT